LRPTGVSSVQFCNSPRATNMGPQPTDILDEFIDLEPEIENFGEAVIRGLSAEKKFLPCKFFYDARGSQLFEQICALEEYYVTRTETALLRTYSSEISAIFGSGCNLIEFGSGSSTKVRILLDSMNDPAGYTAIDISREHLLASCAELAQAYPDLSVRAVCADYSEAMDLPALSSADHRPIVFFPGSSLGNFNEVEAVDFLSQVADFLGKSGGGLLIGIDLKKDEAVLNAAYDDAKGVTAEFNLNLLVRANHELGANFDMSAFRHKAFYNSAEGRIEMHLVSAREQAVTIGDKILEFAADEHIHTENSYKYSVEQFSDICLEAGFGQPKVWCDENDLFSVHYLETS